MKIRNNPAHTSTSSDPSSDVTEEIPIDERQADKVEINRYALSG